jgi:hypothetical protein
MLLLAGSIHAQQSTATFAVNTTTVNPVASVSHMTCRISNGKVLLQWNIVNNEQADQFEIESSTDGNTFTMAALVFATEKAESDDYFFYEKAKKKKSYYRVKIINKDKSIRYSSIIAP